MTELQRRKQKAKEKAYRASKAAKDKKEWLASGAPLRVGGGLGKATKPVLASAEQEAKRRRDVEGWNAKLIEKGDEKDEVIKKLRQKARATARELKGTNATMSDNNNNTIATHLTGQRFLMATACSSFADEGCSFSLIS